MIYGNFIRCKQVKFFILSGNLLLRESPFHIAKFLKSFDFKLFFVCLHIKIAEGSLLVHWHIIFALI